MKILMFQVESGKRVVQLKSRSLNSLFETYICVNG